MSSRMTIGFATDLGTTNSIIAFCDGQTVQVFQNNFAQDTTPSAVSINKVRNTGELITNVGTPAKNSYYQGKDAALEFKREMGGNMKFAFRKAGIERTPVELSAEVLKALRGDVQRTTGEVPYAMVITVPAVFPQSACDATKRAAELAGFTQVLLLQEPVAAAVAYSHQKQIADLQYWLVFDFGGGTFDAALLQARRGAFTVRNHQGDNFLGGAEIDWDLLEQVVIPQLTKDYTLPGFKRGAKQWEHQLRLLKYVVEQAKIMLSGQESVTLQGPVFTDKDDNEVDYSTITLTRADVRKIARPHIDKAVAYCKQLLADSKLTPGDLSKVILVGGPTQAPYFRQILSDYFGKNKEGEDLIDFSQNPMTVVARGAAIYASQKKCTPPTGGEQGVYDIVWKSYEPTGMSASPLVSGKLSSKDTTDFSGWRIEFINTTTDVRSGAVTCEANGQFVATLHAQRDKPGVLNLFRIELKDATGMLRETTIREIPYTISPPVSLSVINSLGIALADNTVEVAYRKGEVLPEKPQARQLRRDSGGVFRTTCEIRKGDATTRLRVAVVEGEETYADLNRVIGEIVVDGTMVTGNLPVQSEVEISLKMDTNRCLFLNVYIPSLNYNPGEKELSLETQMNPKEMGLREKYAQQLQRAKDAVNALQDAGVDRNDRLLSALMDEVSGWKSSTQHRAIEEKIDIAERGGDGSVPAAAQADQLIRVFMKKIYELEDSLKLPQAIKEAAQAIHEAEHKLMTVGATLPPQMRIGFQQALEQAGTSLDAFRAKARNADSAEQKAALLEELEKVKSNAIQILFYVGAPLIYKELCGMEHEATDLNAYRQAKHQGAEALANGDIQALVQANQRMISLLRRPPPTTAGGHVQ
ncbi:MAG: Hsp70 family protein [Kiritimatiellaeota bacterium]|nr:Hsp70 family protein [Kiritimatiellota bacterium]